MMEKMVVQASRRADGRGRATESRDRGRGPLTVMMAEGIHVLGETALFSPRPGRFTKDERLVIRAEVLPDDVAWDHGRMPTVIPTMPMKDTWNGKPDTLGGAADGILVESSHVTIQGLRILGMPIVESPRPGVIKRLYAVTRLRPELDDLEIAQCVFEGSEMPGAEPCRHHRARHWSRRAPLHLPRPQDLGRVLGRRHDWSRDAPLRE